MDCSRITVGLIAANCAKTVVQGVGSKVILLNYEDINRDLSVVVGNVVSNIELKADVLGFEFETLPNATDVDTTIKKGKYFPETEDNVVIRIFVKTQAAKDFIESLKMGKVIPIHQNKELGEDGDTQYEAHGWDCGLEMLECKSTSAFADKVVYEIKLGFGDAKETGLPKSVFKTSTVLTEAMLTALTAAQ